MRQGKAESRQIPGGLSWARSAPGGCCSDSAGKQRHKLFPPSGPAPARRIYTEGRVRVPPHGPPRDPKRGSTPGPEKGPRGALGRGGSSRVAPAHPAVAPRHQPGARSWGRARPSPAPLGPRRGSAEVSAVEAPGAARATGPAGGEAGRARQRRGGKSGRLTCAESPADMSGSATPSGRRRHGAAATRDRERRSLRSARTRFRQRHKAHAGSCPAHARAHYNAISRPCTLLLCRRRRISRRNRLCSCVE